jgi:uncharacterized protein
MRIFLDANVLFTASHNPEGKAAFVIELGNAGHFQVFTSDYACEEARRNLSSRYPGCLARFEHLAGMLKIVRARPTAAVPKGLTEKDVPIFQAAVACRATHLLSGDLRHFGSFMNQPAITFSIRVQTVAEFLELLRSGGGLRK